MTKEQEQAIKVLEQYKKECIEEYKVELDDKDNIDQPHAFYLHQQIEAIYTVLNMLKEKDKEIIKLAERANEYKKAITCKDCDCSICQAHINNLKLREEIELAKEQLKKQCEIADERNDLLVKVQKLQKENEEKDKKIKKNLDITIKNIITDELIQQKNEEIILKDKQIDLMAEYIADISDCPLENCDTDLDCENRCNADIEKECWIKYFENKVKGE